jgi:hypothetical protein
MRLALLLLVSAMSLGAADLALPPLASGEPQPGKRATVIAPEYAGSKVRHLIALPDDWTPDWKARGKSWPVIAEYTGNYFPTSGSTGEVEGAGLGYGVSRGKAIWVVLPKTNIPRICAEFGGDPKKVVLCGFSRGAIGVSFLGLHNDDVAKLWCGLWAHDHFDGMLEWKGHDWGSPLARYREEASVRVRRLQGRPLLVSQAGAQTRRFIDALAPSGVTYLTVDMAAHFGTFPNELAKHPHNDRWPLRDGDATSTARAWFERMTATEKPAK